jgi:RNA polymerase sigma factor (sigma-70 family)
MSVQQADLPTLVVAAQTGDHQAFGHLVHKFQDMAVGYAYSIIGDFHLAEDAAQEAFVGAWTNLPRLQDPKAFAGWFRQMVLMRCTRFTRKMHKSTTTLSENTFDLPDDTDIKKRAKTEEKDALYRILNTLPQEERVATTLFYISQYTHADIATFLDLSSDTVNNRLRSARRLIKEGLDNMDHLKDQAPSRNTVFENRIAELTQPDSMNTEHYIYGTEVVNGHDAWALFNAAASGDLARVQKLVDRDPALVNAQYWYQFPLHFAAKEGHADVVQYLVEHGAELGKSRYMYNSWNKLIDEVDHRGHQTVKKLIEATLQERYNYHPNFNIVRDAIQARDRETVEKLISENPKLATASDAFGNTGLHWATLTRQTQLIDRFLELGVSIDAKRADSQTPIMLSINGDYWYRWNRNLPKKAIQNQWVITGYLLAKGAAVTLCIACSLTDQMQVEILLKNNPSSANILDAQGASPLYHAVKSNQLKIVEILLKHGADPNQPEHNAPKGHALHEAAAKNNMDMVRMLLKAGANPNGDVDSSGNVLHISKVKNPNNDNAVQELLRSHGAYNAPYDLSDEELKDAIKNNHPILQDSQIIQEILSREDPQMIDIMLAKQSTFISRILPGDVYGGTMPRKAFTQKLIDHGLDVNKPNWIGRTFLHSCARQGQIDAAEALLDAGANIDAIELEYGGTALAEAVREGQIEMVKFLLNRGANPNAPEGSEWATAKATAQRQDDPEIKKCFP